MEWMTKAIFVHIVWRLSYSFLYLPLLTISFPSPSLFSLHLSWSNDSWRCIEPLVGDQSSWSEHSADCLSRGPLERSVWKCFVNLSCFKGQGFKKRRLFEKCCCMSVRMSVCKCVCVCVCVREALSASSWLCCPLLVWMLKQSATSPEPEINNFHCLSCWFEICTAPAREARWDEERRGRETGCVAAMENRLYKEHCFMWLVNTY